MFELCLLWLLLFLPAQGFLVWFPGASLLLLLRFRPTNHSKTQKFLSHCVPPPAPARSLPLIGQPRGAVRRAAAELHRFCAFDCFRLVVCCGHHLAMSGMSLMPLHFQRGSVASAVCHLCPSPVATAAAVCCSQPSCRSRCLACRCFVPMHFTELPFSILLLHLLDFLPLGSASCIAAAAHFLDVPAKRFREYVRTIKRACSRKLRPLLELGFNAPCLSFRHQPALLWDPWLQPTECPWHPVGGDSGFAQREDDVEASVCRLAASYLGLPAQGPAAGAFQRFLAQDGFAPLRLLHCVGAAPLQYQVTSFCLFSSCSLFSLHSFFLFRTAQANEDALAWLPLYNHDLGGSEEYDDAVLWLHRSLQQTVWYPHLGHSSVPASVRTACPQLPAPGEAGSFLLLYIRHLNLGMMLVCWEAENAAGWPRMGGTAWRETAPV